MFVLGEIIHLIQWKLYSQVSRNENRRSVSVGATTGSSVGERHSYAEGRVPAPHGPPSSPGATIVQRRVAAACQASRLLLEETLAKPGNIASVFIDSMYFNDY